MKLRTGDYFGSPLLLLSPFCWSVGAERKGELGVKLRMRVIAYRETAYPAGCE